MSASGERKLMLNIALVAVLLACLAVTTFALVFVTVTIENNIIKTGEVAVNLNDGNPVVTMNEFVFEPGMTVEKKFFIENLTDTDAYYRLYFENVSGALTSVLDVQIRNGDNVLYAGKVTELVFDKENPPKATDCVLKKADGKRELTIAFHFPESGTSALQGTELKFDLVADAVQAKNNPAKEFNDKES